MREYISTMKNWVIKIKQNKYSLNGTNALNVTKQKIDQYLKDTYTETHHIVPYCISKDNSKNNLVVLTAREHYIAHLLLWQYGYAGQMA